MLFFFLTVQQRENTANVDANIVPVKGHTSMFVEWKNNPYW
jgi:hypothetical protein